MSDGDSRLLHAAARSVRIHVPDEIAAEVALRIPPDASRATVEDALRDHLQITPEFVTPDSSDAVEKILADS